MKITLNNIAKKAFSSSSHKKNNDSSSAFTIVELLIVIVVIAILAAITIVAYTGITKRASETTLQSDLKNASTKLATTKIASASDSYPGTSEADSAFTNAITKSPDTTFRYTASGSGDTATYCLTAYSTSNKTDKSYYVSNTNTTVREGTCEGHTNPNGNLPTYISAGGFGNNSGGGSVTWPWPESAQNGDLMLIGQWGGDSGSGSHTVNVRIGGVNVTPIDSWSQLSSETYYGAVYVVTVDKTKTLSAYSSTWTVGGYMLFRNAADASLLHSRGAKGLNANSELIDNQVSASLIATIIIPRKMTITVSGLNDFYSWDTFRSGWLPGSTSGVSAVIGSTSSGYGVYFAFISIT